MVETKSVKQTREFIKTHPKMSFDVFKDQTGIKINECYYYEIRREFFPHGTRSNSVNKSCVYIGITAIPVSRLSNETKEVLNEVIKALNSVKDTRLEIIENIKNKTLEIRIRELEQNETAYRAKNEEIQRLRERVTNLETQLDSQKNDLLSETKRQLNSKNSTHRGALESKIEELRISNAKLEAALKERDNLISTNEIAYS